MCQFKANTESGCITNSGAWVKGWWKGDESSLSTNEDQISEALATLESPVVVVNLPDGSAAVSLPGSDAEIRISTTRPGEVFFPVLAILPGLPREFIGDPDFCREHGLKLPFLCGSMAHGISSPAIVKALGRAGMMGFIGSAGKDPEQVEALLVEMKEHQSEFSYGFNLIHSPNEPHLEDALVDLYLKHGLKLIEASAFMAMTSALTRYRVAGITRLPDGSVHAPNKIIGKASRVEVATKFLSPPPEKILKELVSKGVITADQAQMASTLPVADNLTAEADSGGHTDNRPAVSLLPTMIALRDRIQTQFGYKRRIRIGLGGGIATPASASAAFAMGAAYIVLGSVCQSCNESGLSEAGREMLSLAGQADTAMAPAGDMFEMGVSVQVLKRGTMFAMRAAKLYELYRKFNSLSELPQNERDILERTVFNDSLEKIWQQTREFFLKRDPAQVDKAERDPRHLMALVFRWYLGKSPHWAVTGEATRRVDFQIWCGPAMGAFNEWAKGSFFEGYKNRDVVTVAENIVFGAAFLNRIKILADQGIILRGEPFKARPVEKSKLEKYLTARK